MKINTILNRKSDKYFSLAFIWQELALRVTSRLEYIKFNPKLILECGCGLGYDTQLLLNKYPQSQIIAVDFAKNLLFKNKFRNQNFLKRWLNKSRVNLLAADVTQLAFMPHSIDLYYANLVIPFLDDYTMFITELRRILKPVGGFCFSGLGVDSFKELRELGFNLANFPDMHDLGDMLLNAGFDNPVVDCERIVIDYNNLTSLLTDIRIVGCGGIIANPSVLTPNKFRQINLNKKIKLTLEIFVAHGWKTKGYIKLAPGENIISFKS